MQNEITFALKWGAMWLNYTFRKNVAKSSNYSTKCL